MKKVLAILLVFTMALAVCGCGDKPAAHGINDFSVSTEGVVSFTEENGEIYYLRENGERVAEIKSGDNISELVGQTVAEYSVINSKTDSNFVKVYRPKGVTDLQLEGTAVKFTEESGKTYKLSVNGKDVSSVSSGTNVADKLADGANRLYVYSDGAEEGDTVKLNAVSNALSVFVHGEETAEISVDGKILFEENYGFEYNLSADGKTGMAVKNGDDISDFLNGLNAGVTPVTLSVTGKSEGGAYYIVPQNSEEYTFSVNRHSVPENITINGNNDISFTGDSETAKLFVNGEYKADVKSGDNIYRFYDGKVNKISLAACTDDAGWQSRTSAESEITLEEKLSVQGDYTDFYQGDEGIAVKGNTGLKITYSETVNLSEISESQEYCLRLLSNQTISSSGFERVIIRFTDVFDSSKGIAFYMVNGTKIGYGSATYFAGGALSVDYGALEPGEFTPVSNPVGALGDNAMDLRIKYNFAESKFYIALDEVNYTYYYGIKSDYVSAPGESLFSENNTQGLVNIEIEYVGSDSASGFIINEIGKM